MIRKLGDLILDYVGNKASDWLHSLQHRCNAMVTKNPKKNIFLLILLLKLLSSFKMYCKNIAISWRDADSVIGRQN